MPATTRTWTGNNLDGDYGNAANWDTGVPQSSDTAIFDASGKTTTVTNTTEIAAAAWIFNGGNYFNAIDGLNTIAGLFFSFNGAGVQVNAGSAVIRIVQHAQVGFFGHADGGNAEYVVNTNSTIHFEPTLGSNGDNKVHVGSIEGDSTATLVLAADQQLFVGGNNLDTNYAGVINAASATPGSLVKVGTGTLTLSGAADTLQSLTIEGGTVALAGSGGADIGEIDFAPLGSAQRQAPSATAEVSLAHHPVTHIGIVTDDDDDGTVLGQLTAVLDLEVAGLAARPAAHSVRHYSPTIRFFGRGDGIDNATLTFVPGATAKYTGAATHEIIVKSGANTVTFDHILQPALIHFAALSDDNGGTLVVPAIVESRPGETVDARHHPPHQPSPGSKPDVIVAYGAGDMIKGLGGKDILVARAPGVALFGGSGADFFVFDAPKASPATRPDVIMDFHHTQGDVIDLYGLFHAAHAQPLAFIGRQSFAHYHHAHAGALGMVRYAGGELQVNLDHKFTTEFAIVVHGAVHPGDLIL